MGIISYIIRADARLRSLGNFRFIGELYKVDRFPLKIIVEVVNTLLVNSSDAENLECLCILLTTIGQKLENQIIAIVEQASSKKGRAPPDRFLTDPKFMTTIFNKVKDFSNNESLPPRVRFALLVSDESTLFFNN